MADSEGVTLDDLIREIEEFPVKVRTALTFAGEDRLVDVLGAVNSTQTQIGVHKRKAASEVSDGEHGETWEVERKRRGVRSYNTSGLISALNEELDHVNTLSLLMWLIEEGVVSLTWNWSPLDKLRKQRNIGFRFATHEIEDGDPEYDIGEFWVDASTRYVPIKEA